MAAAFRCVGRGISCQQGAAPIQRCLQGHRSFKTIAVEVEKASDEFLTNAKHFAKKREYLKSATRLACAGGGEKVIESHRKRGKMLADERLWSVLDQGSEFLELSTLAGLGMDYGNVPRAGILTGIGKVCGIYCYICVNDSTVKGGTMFPIAVTKQLRAQQIAIDNRIPCIYITDSGGAFLPLQDEIFPDKHHGGRGFYNEAILSSLGVPQVAVVCGHCTAGGAYIPTMSQEAVIVHKMGAIFLGGPPLVFAALGERVSVEDLGGANLHCKESGCADYFSSKEPEAYESCREIVETFNMSGPVEHQTYEEPIYACRDLDGLIPHTELHKLDAMQVIARILDGSKFHEFKKMYGTGLVTGFGKIQGHLVGVVANQGELCGDSATKGSNFVQLCDQRNVPLIFLQNLWPTEECSDAIDMGYTLRCHAHMIGAVSCATVPKFTIKIGNDLDDSAFTMGGRALDATFVFSWPSVRSYQVDKEELYKGMIEKKFPKGVDTKSEDYKAFMKKIVPLVEHRASSLYGSSLLKDDGVILPEETRKTLGMCLGITSQPPPGKEVLHGVVRM